MADTRVSQVPHCATSHSLPATHLHPAAAAPLPAPPEAITITRTVQSAVLRLRWTLAALKFAADGEHENPQQQPLFWSDLIDALALLTPDANVLDLVVDELRRAQRETQASVCATPQPGAFTSGPTGTIPP